MANSTQKTAQPNHTHINVGKDFTARKLSRHWKRCTQNNRPTLCTAQRAQIFTNQTNNPISKEKTMGEKEKQTCTNDHREMSSGLNCVYDFLAQHSKLKGAKALNILISMPERPVFCKALSMAVTPIDSKYTVSQLEHLIRMQEVIPMTDIKALSEVRKYVNKQTIIKAELTSNGMDTAEVDRKIQLCSKYISETTKPMGIKKFDTDEKLSYDSITASIRRLLVTAEVECPEAAYNINQHLTTGKYFVWHL